MKQLTKLSWLTVCCWGLFACGSSLSGSNGASGNNPTPTPASVPQVNIGNISAIPLNGNQTTTAVIVTNNSSVNLTLASASMTQGSQTTGLNLATGNSTQGGLINVTQCATLQASGTCSVAVSAPSNSGSYVLTLNYVDANGKGYSSSQIVTYSNTIAPADGFSYSSLNTNVYTPPGGSSTLAIPFVLDNSYAQLYAYSSNPSFATSFSCPGGSSYNKGDLCTAYVKVANLGTNPAVTATITVASFPNPNPLPGGETSLQIQRSLKTAAAKSTVSAKQMMKGATGFSFSTPVTVINTTAGNLVSSAFNVVINPSDGAHAQTVTLLNNGSATISGITLTPVGGVITIGSNTCSSLTAPSGSCTFTVNANSQVSGQNSVNISYTNGGSGNTLASLPFSVVYVSAAPGPGLSMTAGQGSLQNAQVGVTSNLNINVKNTGTVNLTALSFTNATASFGSQFAYDTTNSTCKTDGSQALVVGAQCTLILQYLPTAAHATTPITITEAASYLDQGGHALIYTGATFGSSYSAFLSNAFVYLTPNYSSYAIRADNTDTATTTLTLVNAGGQPVTLGSPSYILAAPISSMTGLHVVDNCASFVLSSAGGTTCTVVLTYGPVAAAQADIKGLLNVAYLPNSSATSVNAFATEEFQAQTAALVGVSNIVVSGAGGGSGNGLVATPYQFFNSPFAGAPQVITFTYANTGTATASNFAVALNNLPVGYVLSGTPTCGDGISPATSSLTAPSGTCTLAISAVGGSALWNPYSFSGALNVNIPGYSYDDVNTGLNLAAAPTWPGHYASGNSIYVNANPLAVVASNNLAHATAESGGSYNVTFTLSAGDAAEYASAGVTVTIPTSSLTTTNTNTIYLTSANTCQLTAISGGGSSCTINISNNVGAAQASYTYQYWITPQGLTPSAANSIVQYFSFSLN